MEDIAWLMSAAFGLLGLGAVMLYVRNSTASGALGRNGMIGIRTKVTKSSHLPWKVSHFHLGSAGVDEGLNGVDQQGRVMRAGSDFA